MTGFSDREIAINALKLGAFDYLDKPFTTDNLCDSISKAIRFDVKLKKLLNENNIELKTASESEYYFFSKLYTIKALK